MLVSTQILYPHMQKAFGIPAQLKVTSLTLRLAAEQYAEIELTTAAQLIDDTELTTINAKLNLSENNAGDAISDAMYWAGVSDALNVNGPPWIIKIETMALKAKAEINRMAAKYRTEL